MLSNKSQYILSKIGIPIFQDAQNPSVNDETTIYFFQKDNILTLHTNSVDEYSEKEIKLLEAIIGAIQGPAAPVSQGEVIVSLKEPLEIKHFTESSNIKATLLFYDFGDFSKSLNPIQSPSLQGMLFDPSLKKDLWTKLKPLHST